MMRSIKKMIKNESGLAALEYGLIASAIAVVILVAVMGLGNAVKGKFEGITKELNKNPTSQT
ncbi:Flp family type IVb pilin [Candidatus Liberibacter americanus]|uniref:Flp pilus assembly protein, pilin Flp n=1 Tax=Candidatus Liberibacter americanus str. Sao Paulo TaxID=1261131 RepID=U6B4P1_9HYPH|nr:Flp family type IVb pilin [Candidatus Liberibacter americanus]AHA27593.1 hypothetical protein lam_220 [Candidatus Liberibacter americanus str. Sao Paulo]EMS36446.1 hypothetical protein G653_00772 [Candidatus Liberibacter americanus PW_SP]